MQSINPIRAVFNYQKIKPKRRFDNAVFWCTKCKREEFKPFTCCGKKAVWMRWR